MRKLTPFYLLVFCILLTACTNRYSQETPEKTAVERLRQVSYNSILELPSSGSGVTLQYGENSLQFGQLYLPKLNKTSSNQQVPLLVFIHGGCWLNVFDIQHTQAFSEAVAAAGIAVWSIEYRRVGDAGGGWPGSYDDVLAGIAHAQTVLQDYSVDLKQVVLAGHSAGGHLALLAAGESYLHTKQNQQGTPLLKPVKGVIGLAAITDLSSYQSDATGCQRATRQFMGGNYPDLAGKYQEASPSQQPSHPTTLLLHGRADTIVPLSQATDSGLPMQLLDDAGHFDWIHPKTEAFQHFLITVQALIAK
ncbi:hypothetical protein GCM10010919_33780 [Alishewanella longhuensis]|uniref:BD-FAE-like domain-containing protein n=1 Tax=Alishewanella longhuensis TaxID=1091037 RepID=A0ABQ3L224_9ALTE|nr:alpha/beta hydrolase [Alishewanella longhuensis]GHG77834.1 hypothetical protein GCM10010919_33780 [Alishewanella longhuensis]